MKKVLIVTSPLRVGGFDVVATNLQTHLDKDKFECTYYIKGEEVGPLEEKAIKSGAKVIHQPDSVHGYFAEYKNLKKVMRDGNYDVVHSHLMFYSGLVMRAAYKAGVKKRIPHSHMTNPCMENRNFIKRRMFDVYSFLMKRWLNKYGTDLIACGPETGEYLYGKKSFEKRGIILNNGIDLSSYKYDPALREKVRNEFNLGNRLVIGHVGRLNYVKNHKFLIDVFYEVQKQTPDSCLLIVGDGEERSNVEGKAKELGIMDKVIITGVRNDVFRLLQAMDVFVFPSLYEGLPVTLIEAQATKLPCLISDSVSRYSKQNENVEFISLSQTAEKWAQDAVMLAKSDRNSVSCEKLIKAYDINEVAKELEKIYEN